MGNSQVQLTPRILLGISSPPCCEPRQQRALHQGGVLCHVLPTNVVGKTPSMGSSMGCEPGYNGICHQQSDISGPEKVGNTHKWQFEWENDDSQQEQQLISGVLPSCHRKPYVPWSCYMVGFLIKGVVISWLTGMQWYRESLMMVGYQFGDFPGFRWVSHRLAELLPV